MLTIRDRFEELNPGQAAAINRLCDRLERSWHEDRVVEIELLLQQISLEIRLVAIHELVLVDLIYRYPKPNRAALQPYLERFAELDSEWLAKQLGLHTSSPCESTMPLQDAWSDLHKARATGSSNHLGKFELVRQIGSGGMGIVFLAQQTDLNRTVAVKTLTKVVAKNQEARRRFRAEVEAVARLHHPHIVQIFEIGMNDGTPYYSMEYVEGGNLSELMRNHPLAPKTAAKLLSFVSRAIHYAHECGIIHRDLKPGNILLAPSKQQDGVLLELGQNVAFDRSGNYFVPKIADFGLAKRLGMDSQDTMQGAALGTPGYMSPEQAIGKLAIGSASDVYSLGAVLYDSLVGRPPFHGATPAETIQRVIHDDPVPIRRLQPDVPIDLETICLKCLSKDPARRYSSALQLAEDLDRFLESKPIMARRANWLELVFKAARRHPAWAAMLLTLILGTVASTWQWQVAEFNRRQATTSALAATEARLRAIAEHDRVEQTLYAHDIALASLEHQANHTRKARDLLSQAPEKLRNWEWYYVKQKIEHGHQELQPFDQPARAVDISPNGRLVVGCTGVWGQPDQGDVRVWDRESGNVLWSKREHPGPVMAVRFDPTGKWIGSCGARFLHGKLDGAVVLWDAETGSVRWRCNDSDAQTTIFSSNGQHFITGTTAGHIVVRDIDTGNVTTQWHAHQQYVSSLAMWPNSSLLVSTGRDGWVKIWNNLTQDLLLEYQIDVPDRVACSIDGRSFSVGTHHGQLYSLQLIDGTVKELFKKQIGDRTGALQYSSDGQYLIASALNQPIQIMDAADGRLLHQLHGHDGNTLDFSQSAGGELLASCGVDGSVICWDLAHSPTWTRHNIGGPFVSDIEFLPNSDLVALANAANPGNRNQQRSIRIWDPVQGRLVRQLNGHKDWLTCLAIDHRLGLILSGSHDQTAKLWRIADWSEVMSFEGHESAVVDVDILDDQRIITAELHGTIRIWDRQSGKVIAQWKLADQCRHVTVELQSGLIASASGTGKIVLFQFGVADPVLVIDDSFSPITELKFSPGGSQLAVAREDATISVWETASILNACQSKVDSTPGSDRAMNPRLKITLSGSVNDFCFSRDGLRLASCGKDRAIKLSDLVTGSEVLSIPNVGLNGYLGRLAFSADGHSIFYCDQNLGESWTIQPPATDYSDWHRVELQKAQGASNWHAVISHFEALENLESLDNHDLVQYGHALAEVGQFNRALMAFQQARELRTDEQANILEDYFLVLLLLQQDQIDECHQLRTKMLTRYGNSGDANTLNSLAWSFLLHPRKSDMESIVVVSEKATTGNRRREYLNTLGGIYLRAGRFEDSIQSLQRSIQQSADAQGDPFDWLLLSLASAATDDTIQADYWLQKVVQFDAEKSRSNSGPPRRWWSKFELERLATEAKAALEPTAMAMTSTILHP